VRSDNTFSQPRTAAAEPVMEKRKNEASDVYKKPRIID
jgi:hypothetical protein